MVIKIFKNKYNMIFELNQSQESWMGFGPSSENNNSYFNWMYENW